MNLDNLEKDKKMIKHIHQFILLKIYKILNLHKKNYKYLIIFEVYELITRHFLAVCSKNAIGSETYVEFIIGNEKFHAKGLIIHERNYLEVYPYEKWGDINLPKIYRN